MYQKQNRQTGWTGIQARRVRRVFPILLLLCVPFLATETSAATSSFAAPETTLEGVWKVRTTLRDCLTDQIVGAAFDSLVTFAPGGTMLESSGSPAFAPGQLSPAHGTWSRIRWNTYRQRMTSIVHFGTSPDYKTPVLTRGWMTTAQTVVPVENEKFVAEGSVGYYDAGGKLYRRVCSTATGSRFK